MDKSSLLESLASPKEMATLVSYAAGSVVSKTLIHKPQGTVTLFAFDEGQGLSEHTAPYDALVTILDGQANLSCNGKTHLSSQGQTLWFPAGKPHAVQAQGPFKMLLVMIRG